MKGIEWRTIRTRLHSVPIVMAMIVAVVAAPAAGALDEGDPSNYQGAPYSVAQRIGLVDEDGNSVTDATGAGVTIALIDTGVVDVPGLRYSNVTIGPDFSFDDMIPDLRGRDGNGHGTHLASIMVASDRSWFEGDHVRTPERVLGIAPDAHLLSIKAGATDGAVDVTQVIAAIDWVVEQKVSGAADIDILNLSFGTNSSNPASTDPLAQAAERAWLAGIVVVVSAGNDGDSGASLSDPAYSPLVVAVGASQVDGGEVEADFTSEGLPNRKIDVSAPGKSIVGLRNPGSFSDAFNEAGRIGEDLVRATGTSQAAAVVSGAVAVLLEARPDLTPDQVKWLLNKTAEKTKSETFGVSHLLDISDALTASVPSSAQSVQLSDGSGSIDAARGTSRLWINGVMLEGEIDIFGNTWSGNTWSGNTWSGNTWSGNTWSGVSWDGVSWDGNTWSGNTWSGVSWDGLGWSGNTWSGNTWSGNTWSGNTWSGNTWSGNTWSGNTWSGNTWSGNTWSGNTWSGNTWSGNTWSGVAWDGNTWSGVAWDGNTWSGNTWSGNTWSGVSWDGVSWDGNTWSGNTWSGNTWSGNTWS